MPRNRSVLKRNVFGASNRTSQFVKSFEIAKEQDLVEFCGTEVIVVLAFASDKQDKFFKFLPIEFLHGFCPASTVQVFCNGNMRLHFRINSPR